MPPSLTVTIDSWYDLVYHVLSLIPIADDDASSLFGRRYLDWARTCPTGTSSVEADALRTIFTDAALLASLYAQSEKGYLLQSLPLLWEDTPAFLKDMPHDFASIPWDTRTRAAQATVMRSSLHPALPDLLRTALWSEIRHGYAERWAHQIEPKAIAYRHRFTTLLGDIAERLPGLTAFRWVLSHPLRCHGRLLSCPPLCPLIVVGVADPHFDVSPYQPVIHGCHEYFVAQASMGVHEDSSFATRTSDAGYATFKTIEEDALARGAAFFLDSPWMAPYLTWLQQFFPHDDPHHVAERLVASAT